MDRKRRRSYTRQPFASSRKKKRFSNNRKAWKPEDVEERKALNTGYSWNNSKNSDGTSCNNTNDLNNTKQKFAVDDYEIDLLTDEECETDEISPDYWIFSLPLLQSALNQVAVCQVCSLPLQIMEEPGRRAGLATTFSISCKNNCNPKSFDTSPKLGHIHEINQTSILASRFIGKGRSGLNKLCSIIGLPSPVSTTSYSDHTTSLEEKAKILLEENLKESAVKVKELELEPDQPKTDVIDIATCFDGTWSSRGWSARDGVVTAISEGTSQIVDVVYKTTHCRLCQKQEKAKEEGSLSQFDYLMWYVKHEPKCLMNHLGSAQVFKVS